MPKQPMVTVKRRKLGKRLRTLRGTRTAADVGKAMGWSESTQSRVESGKKALRIRDVRKLLDVTGASTRQRNSTLALAREARQEGWWHEYNEVLPEDFGSFVDFEDEAEVMYLYEPVFVPGILQTEEYTRLVLRAGRLNDSDDEIEQRVETRVTRKEILERRRPPRILTVLEEAVIRRRPPWSHVMRGQLQHLLDLGAEHNITIQIVPANAELHAATGAPFIIFDFEDDELPSVVYFEQRRSSVTSEREDIVRDSKLAFADAQSTALSPADSASLIADCLEELR